MAAITQKIYCILLSLLIALQPVQASIPKANLAMADFQTLIGDQKLMEGSIEHMALHGVVGCAFAEISGGD
ncbi:MAG: hypothetical protein V3V13_02805, partial [Paracoccaceae bacterium]